MLLAKHLSEAKARAIDSTDSIIISGDLFVVFEGKVYEKPADKEEAYSMLRAFSGKPIDIIAGVAVHNSNTKRITSGVEKCTVKFRELSDFEIRDYISRNPVTRFAAGFDMDGTIRFAESVTGYPFMTGFPVKLLIELLREQGIKV
jgi:predicted house-cleaning NTP pyrophosphatase (Maf/HAM1 superfamily)